MRTVYLLLGVLLLTLSPSVLASGFPTVFDPATLRSANGGDGSEGINFEVTLVSSARGVLDITGDGIADAGVTDSFEENRIFILQGGPGPWTPDLVPGDNPVYEITNLPVHFLNPEFDMNISTAGGDYSGDGIGDMIVGRRAYCVYSCNYASPVWHIMRGLNSIVTWSYGSPKFIGDVNGDGKDDILSNSGYNEGPNGNPRIYMDSTSVSLVPPAIWPTSLCRLSGGDINGDGFGDVGFAEWADYAGGQGRKYYYLFGSANLSTLGEIEMTSIGTSLNPGVTITHGSVDACSIGVSGRGDFNGDGSTDLIVTASSNVYILFGSTLTNGEVIDIALLNPESGGDGSDGIAIRSGQAISSISYLGDINNDGFDDVGVAFSTLPYGGVVIYGRASSPAATIEIDSLYPANGGDGSNGFVIADTENNIVFGSPPLGDFNADGADDLMLTVKPNALESITGYTYIAFGREQISDQDSDGANDLIDNCLFVSNSGQLDADSDGYGTACDADFDNNCVVNFIDFQMFVDNFGNNDPEFNLDGVGSINFLDLSLFSSMFLQAPGPSATTNTCD